LATPLVAGSAEEKLALQWTDATPDAMLDDATARALSPDSTVRSQLAALATIAALRDRSEYGHALKAFERVASAPTLGAEVRGQAALLARMGAGDRATEAGSRADQGLGVVASLSILGPFRDTGGGLETRDGPEEKGAFGDMNARYAWGAYDVAWRAIPRAFASAEGVPLDVFVFPRKESCTWLATKLTVATRQTVSVWLAASGQIRLVFDGVDVGRDDTVNLAARFDRLAAKVVASAGMHLLAAKVCSGALEDEGRVRLRVTDPRGAWPEGVGASADLTGLPSSRPHAPRVEFARVGTPLTRALAQVRTGPDGLLEAAVLRTLGGADDLRSPRAPGMLAALADGAVHSDRLAMAAWITPNGPSRSTWLNRVRADKTADPRVRAFAERRLVERHLDAGLTDWAMASARGATIDLEKDPEAILITARVETALGTDALRLRATRRLASVAGELAGAPDVLLEVLAELAASHDPALAAATRERLAQRGQVSAAQIVALQTRGRAAVVSAAKQAMASGIDSDDEGLAIVQAVARTGDHDEARALYELLSRWAPNRASVWAGLAHEMGGTQPDAMRDESIAAALRRARELDPAEARYRAELALRTRTTPAEERQAEESYLVSSQTILARKRGVAQADDAPLEATARELHWLRAVEMHSDRRVSELVHYAREIVIAPRTEEELYEDIPVEGDLTEIMRARVHRQDGGSAFPVEQTSDNAHPRIRWPELRPGDVVEVAFRSWTAGPVGGRGDPPFYRLDYAGSLSTRPVLYNEVNVESPADRPIYVDVVNGRPDRRAEKTEGGRHFVRLIWDKPVNIPDEPLAPPLSEVVPTVVLSTFKDWHAFRDWYGEAVRGFTEPDAQVRDLATKLTQGKGSRESKLQALFDFVADDIRYVNYVSGEWWLPNRPQQLLARREGDCDDKALLLITLLKAAGIDAQEVLVQTRLTAQPSIVRAPGAAVPLFDHGIAFLPGRNGGTYLDATSPQSRLGPLPSMDARAVALRMDGPPEIVALPASTPDDHGVDATWTIALQSDGSADLEGEERATGDDAFWMRTYLTEPGTRAPWVEEHLVGNWFSSVEVDKKVDFRGDLARGAALMRWHARSTMLARHEGDVLVVPLAPSQTTASQLAPLVNRTLPVWLPSYVAPRKESRAIRIVAPRGWSFQTLPPGGDENGGAFGRAHLDVQRDPRDDRSVVVHRTIVFDQSTIPTSDYPNWRGWVQRVDALMHRSVRLQPASGASK
jgi:hypothetical protein